MNNLTKVLEELHAWRAVQARFTNALASPEGGRWMNKRNKRDRQDSGIDITVTIPRAEAPAGLVAALGNTRWSVTENDEGVVASYRPRTNELSANGSVSPSGLVPAIPRTLADEGVAILKATMGEAAELIDFIIATHSTTPPLG